MSKTDFTRHLNSGTREGKETAVGFTMSSIHDEETIHRLSSLSPNDAIDSVLEMKARGERLASRSLPRRPSGRGVPFLMRCFFSLIGTSAPCATNDVPACLSFVLSHHISLYLIISLPINDAWL